MTKVSFLFKIIVYIIGKNLKCLKKDQNMNPLKLE